MTRREHAAILGDVLALLANAQLARTPVNVTTVARRANLPHDRLIHYIDELRQRGLVVAGPVPELTVEGARFLECYNAWLDVQAKFALPPTPMTGPAPPVPPPSPDAVPDARQMFVRAYR